MENYLYYKIGFFDGFLFASSDTIKTDWTEDQLESYQFGFDDGVSKSMELQ